MEKRPRLNVFFNAAFRFLLLRNQEKKGRLVFHYSILDAIRNGVFEGDLTVRELKGRGDFGLGTYNGLDGEMIALDGIFYRADHSGAVSEVKLEWGVPYACLAFFKAGAEYKMTGVENLDMLEKQILGKLPSFNRPYALRIECSFESVSVACAGRVDAGRNASFDQVMENRAIYQKEHVSGTIVGFYNPPSFASVDLSPFHFHFISDDKKYGGHLMSGDFSAVAITIAIDEKSGYEILLPKGNREFDRRWDGLRQKAKKCIEGSGQWEST